VSVWNDHHGSVTLDHFPGVGLHLTAALLHHTISCTRAAAALPSLIGGPRQGLILSAGVYLPRMAHRAPATAPPFRTPVAVD
jgi:hypothetical protein